MSQVELVARARGTNQATVATNFVSPSHDIAKDMVRYKGCQTHGWTKQGGESWQGAHAWPRTRRGTHTARDTAGVTHRESQGGTHKSTGVRPAIPTAVDMVGVHVYPAVLASFPGVCPAPPAASFNARRPPVRQRARWPALINQSMIQ